MSKWTEKDTARETNSSIKEVKKSFHQARNDAAKEGGWGVPEDRHRESNNNADGKSNNDDSDE